MPQFSVYRNKSENSSEFPLLLDIQNDLLSDLQTRVVIPLRPKASRGLQTMARLIPQISFEGESYLLVTPKLAGIGRSELGAEVGDLSEYRDTVLAAIDLLIVGF